MRRRDFLAVIASTTPGLAGCMELEPTETTPTDSETPGNNTSMTTTTWDNEYVEVKGIITEESSERLESVIPDSADIDYDSSSLV